MLGYLSAICDDVTDTDTATATIAVVDGSVNGDGEWSVWNELNESQSYGG